MAGYIMTIGAGEYLSLFTKGTKPEREEMAKRKSMEECILRGSLFYIYRKTTNSNCYTS